MARYSQRSACRKKKKWGGGREGGEETFLQQAERPATLLLGRHGQVQPALGLQEEKSGGKDERRFRLRAKRPATFLPEATIGAASTQLYPQAPGWRGASAGRLDGSKREKWGRHGGRRGRGERERERERAKCLGDVTRAAAQRQHGRQARAAAQHQRAHVLNSFSFCWVIFSRGPG